MRLDLSIAGCAGASHYLSLPPALALGTRDIPAQGGKGGRQPRLHVRMAVGALRLLAAGVGSGARDRALRIADAPPLCGAPGRSGNFGGR
jgi:hypothetical protein